MEKGQWVKWVTIFGSVTWVMGHCHWPIDPLWRNNCAIACNFLFWVDIKKLLTHSISPIIIAGGLILIYVFFAFMTERVVQYHHATTPPSPVRRGNDHGSWVMGHAGHGSTVWWVIWVMGHERWPISISGQLYWSHNIESPAVSSNLKVTWYKKNIGQMSKLWPHEI